MLNLHLFSDVIDVRNEWFSLLIIEAFNVCFCRSKSSFSFMKLFHECLNVSSVCISNFNMFLELIKSFKCFNVMENWYMQIISKMWDIKKNRMQATGYGEQTVTEFILNRRMIHGHKNIFRFVSTE